MVLQELGSKLLDSLQKLHSANTVDTEVVDAFLKSITFALLEADVNVKQVYNLKENIKNAISEVYKSEGTVNPSYAKRKLHKEVVSELVALVTPNKPTTQSLRKGRVNVVMFVGLQGAGKTTSCTKYAAYYKAKGFRSALVCADTFRAGAFDQLKQNATRCKIPFYGSYSENDPVVVAKMGVEVFKKENMDLIIVDTSGRHKQESELFVEMQQISDTIKPDQVVFVMDSHMGQSCGPHAEAFAKAVNVGGVIVTKLDGHAKGGGALSAVAATDSPILFFGTGEQFEEFEPFDASSFVSRLLNMGDPQKLIERMNELVPVEKQPELMQKMVEGTFTLRDMQEQLEGILKMGSLSQFMSMIPGMGSFMNSLGATSERSSKTLKQFLCMMDSMSNDEKDGKVVIDDSRVLRIARGSGSQVWEVKLVLSQYEKMSKMMTGMARMAVSHSGGPKVAKSHQQAVRMNNEAKNMRKMMGAAARAGGGGDANNPNGMIENLMRQMYGGGPGGPPGGGPGNGGVPPALLNMMKKMGLN